MSLKYLWVETKQHFLFQQMIFQDFFGGFQILWKMLIKGDSTKDIFVSQSLFYVKKMSENCVSNIWFYTYNITYAENAYLNLECLKGQS